MPRGLHVLVEGRVRVLQVLDGRPQVIHTEEPGGVLGDVPLFGGGVYPATAVAASRATCLVFDTDAIAAAIRHDPQLAFALLGRLAGRVRLLIRRLGAITGQSVATRVAAYLWRRAADAGDAGTPTFRLGCTQSELAEELGTVREVVVRALRDLRTAGIIESTRNGVITVRDMAALARRAQAAG